MSVVQKFGGWVKKSYELLVLLIVLIALVGSAALLVIKTESENSKLSNTRSLLDRTGKPAERIELKQSSTLIGSLQHDYHELEYENRMFVSEKRVACINCGKPIAFYDLKCFFCGAEQPRLEDDIDESLDTDMDGIPDKWEEAHGLDSNDPDDAHMDADGDGFTNLEEYKAETDPRNADDFPDLTTKIRLVDVKREEFQLRFNSVQEMPGNVLRFQINLRSLRRTYFPELGDVIDDEENDVKGVRILEYAPDAAEGPTLIIEKGGERVKLVKQKKVVQYDLVARVAFLLDRKMYRLNVDDVFQVRGEKFKVVDIKRDSVLLVDLESGIETEISKMTEEEISKMRGRSGGRLPANAPEFMRENGSPSLESAPGSVDRGRRR